MKIHILSIQHNFIEIIKISAIKLFLQCTHICVSMASCSEHARVSPRKNIPISQPFQSSIREHSLSCNFNVHIRDFGIISTSNNITDLKNLQSVHIHKHKPILNSTVSAYPLSIVK